MWKTTEGETLAEKLLEFRRMEEEEGPLNVSMQFNLDSKSSAWYRDEELEVNVDMDTIWVVLTCRKNTIRIPNMQYGTLGYMIEYAAEILLFEADLKIGS